MALVACVNTRVQCYFLHLRFLEPAGSNRYGARQPDCESAKPAIAPSVLMVIGSSTGRFALNIEAEGAFEADPPGALEVHRKVVQAVAAEPAKVMVAYTYNWQLWLEEKKFAYLVQHRKHTEMLAALRTADRRRAIVSELESGETTTPNLCILCINEVRTMCEGRGVCGLKCARIWLEVRQGIAVTIQRSFRANRTRKQVGRLLAAALKIQHVWRESMALKSSKPVEQGVGHAFTGVRRPCSIAVGSMSTEGGRIQSATITVNKVDSGQSPSWFGILGSQDNKAELIFERLNGKLLIYAEPLHHNLLIDIAEYAALERRWVRLIPTSDEATVDVEDWIMREAVALAGNVGMTKTFHTIRQLLRNFDERVAMVMTNIARHAIAECGQRASLSGSISTGSPTRSHGTPL